MTTAAGPAGARRQSFLAFDIGVKRVGVATGNSLMRSAQPLRTIAAEGDARFRAIEALIREWDKRFPGRVENMFNALGNVVPSHLMDASLFAFKGLRATGQPDPQGDIAFDEEPCASDTPQPSAEGTPISFARFDDL